MMVMYDWDDLTAWSGSDSIPGDIDTRTGVDPVHENGKPGLSGNGGDRYHPYLGYLK